jgi:hypothetical protein
MGEETNQGARKSLLKSGRSIKAAGNELQNLDRVEARSEIIGHDAVSRIEYSSDAKWRAMVRPGASHAMNW